MRLPSVNHAVSHRVPVTGQLNVRGGGQSVGCQLNDAANRKQNPNGATGLSAFPSANQIVRLVIHGAVFPDNLGVTAQRSFDGQIASQRHRRSTLALIG